MAKKNILGIPQHFFIFPLIAIAIATFGFGIYLGKMQQTVTARQLVSDQAWRTYYSPEGWRIRHPRDVLVMRDSNFLGYAEEGAFFTPEATKTTLFSEENIHGSRIQVGIIPNTSGLHITEWVGQWKEQYRQFCYCTLRPDSYFSPVTAGPYQGLGLQAGTDEYSSYFIFIPIKEDKIIWGNVTTNDQRDASQWSKQLLRDMLGTARM